MHIFVTGTDTNIGKTLICSWLCLHTNYDYFKPIQTGNIEGTDRQTIELLTKKKMHDEKYNYRLPLSPHLAAHFENETIDLDHIDVPASTNLIIEGAGGVLVPVNKDYLMIDLMEKLNVPVIVVASSRLGTINHTLLTLMALRLQKINVLGVILNGEKNQDNANAIEFYGNTKVLAHFPILSAITVKSLKAVKLTPALKMFF